MILSGVFCRRRCMASPCRRQCGPPTPPLAPRSAWLEHPWVSRQPQPHTHNAADYRWARWRFISDARQWLSFLGRLRTTEAPRRPYADLIEGFRDYMIRERGLGERAVAALGRVRDALPRVAGRARLFERFDRHRQPAVDARQRPQTSSVFRTRGLRRFFQSPLARISRRLGRDPDNRGGRPCPGRTAAAAGPRQAPEAARGRR